MKPSHTVILGVAASDAHIVANKLIEMALTDHGFNVVNLGACTTIDEFCQAYVQNKPVLAIVIGSLNGHAVNDITGLALAKRQYKVTCPVIVGGNLSVGSQKDSSIHQELYGLGVDVILHSPLELIAVLEDLAAKADQVAQNNPVAESKHEVMYVIA
jgi:methylaspartate mutase sigma subunit